MSKPMIRINDNGNIIDREMTDDEFSQYEMDIVNHNAKIEAQLKAEADKVTAEAKIAALGLTTDDLKALGL
jgi:hypothetical protein